MSKRKAEPEQEPTRNQVKIPKEAPLNKQWPECCDQCSSDWKNKASLPDSNELLNIFLIIIGGITVIYGLSYYFPSLFTWLQDITTNPDFQTYFILLGSIYVIFGFSAIIAGIGMFQEQEWAWGMALLILAFIMINAIITLITTLAGGSFSLYNISFWIQIVSVPFAAFGIPWLLATKERYF
ncbi:MAG: hypothetical protein ACFFD2_02600 [Promethearchaeota archaeon]